VYIDKLEQLFHTYLHAFINYDISAVSECYQDVCSLTTPDKMLVIETKGEFEQEFQMIFTQLRQAGMTDVKALNASCISVGNNIVLACVDWAFYDNDKNVFADFSAFYHLEYQQGCYKIFSVNSQDLSQSKQFTQNLNIK